MHPNLVSIGEIMALCFLAWGLFHAYLYRRGMEYVRGFLWGTAYFTFVALFLAELFWDVVEPFVLPVEWAALGTLVIFLLLVFAWSVYVPTRLPAPKAYFDRHPERYYLRIHWRRVISKSADIAAQQVFILVLVALLGSSLSMVGTICAFFALFAILHIPLIARERESWPSLAFGGAVVLFSVIFPPIILLVPYGFVYTFMIHWMFYIAVASVFWMYHAEIARYE